MKDTNPVIDAMRTTILFREMYDFCMERINDNGKSACVGCPYQEDGVCGKISTINMIRNVADIFQEYLDDM